VAAGALSCEIAVIRVEQDGHRVVESIGLDPATQARIQDGSDADPLWADTPDGPRVQQVATSDLADADIVSSISLPIGSQPTLGVLALAHATARPRGFTSLCQRIGRAVAEAAELLITQATAREALASERDRLARASQIDAMTGLANRRAWDEEAQRLASAGVARGHVVTIDLDELKQTNDRFGHPAGDELIRGAAAVLLASVRSTDLVARIGGDEFAVLLRDADSATAGRIRARLRRAERRWRAADKHLVLRLSMGVAPMCDGDLESARRAADRRMYANKRRRLAAVTSRAKAA
jgi:diguanylate cyclase (GGDEF)-like protein